MIGKEGFSVAFGMLMDANKKVNAVLGTNLVLAELQQTGTYQDDVQARADSESRGDRSTRHF